MKIYLRAVSIVVFCLWLPLVAAADDQLDFSVNTDAGVLLSESLVGQVTYIDFWASWCIPCRKSFPWMNEMQAKYQDQAFKIIAINLDKEKSLAAKFLETRPADFTVGYDPKGQLAEKFGVVGMPMAFLLNHEGEVVEKHIGFKISKIPLYEQSIKDALESTK